MGNNFNCLESNTNFELYTEYIKYLHEFTEKQIKID